MKPPSLLALACLALLPACRKPLPEPAAEPAVPAEVSAVLARPITAEATPIHLARTTATPGDKVVLKGRVMGSAAPFVDGRAALILGDPEVLTPCNERPGDGCPTPWDTCCNSKEELRRGTATVQVLGADGRVARVGLEGLHGLEKLGTVTVEGTVAETSGEGNLIVNATAIRVE